MVRFWFEHGQGPVTDSDGFLVPPSTDGVWRVNWDAIRLEALADVHIAILTGPPGIGKTTEIRRIAEATGAYIDLRAYSADKSLADEMALQAQSGAAALWLDGLDECPVPQPQPTLARVIARIARGLNVRVACRSAWYTEGLRDEIEAAMSPEPDGDDRPPVVIGLAPLCRSDALELLGGWGDSAPERTLASLSRVGALSFATNPQTLRLVFGLMRSGQGIPTNSWDLYQIGCKAMCDEIDAGKRRAGRNPASANERLRTLRRLACLSLLSQRSMLAEAPEFGDCAAVGVGDLPDDLQPMGSAHVLFDTPLLIASGNCLTWAHATFAEFLTAWETCEAGLDLRKLRQLFVDSDSRKVYPRLGRTASWVAAKNPEFRDYLAENDPSALVQSDLLSRFPLLVAPTLEAVMGQIAERKLSELSVREGYDNFRYPGLAAHLRPYISGKDHDVVQRRVAIDIAEANKVGGLVPDLLHVALDAADDPLTRAQAAHAIVRIGDVDARRQLKPLAMGLAGPDPDDELKGVALRSCYPDHLTVEELLGTLTSPKRTSFLGAYRSFIEIEFKELLRDEHVAPILVWLAKTDRPSLASHEFGEEAFEAIVMARAWYLINKPNVLEALSRLVAKRLGQGHEPFSWSSYERDGKMKRDEFYACVDQRRALCEAVLALPGADDAQLKLEFAISHELLDAADFPWALDKAALSPTQDGSKRWASVASNIFDRSQQHFEWLLRHASNQMINDAFAYWIRSVPLDSKEAARYREQHRQANAWRSRLPQVPDQTEAIVEALGRLIAQAEEDPSLFWQAHRHMIYDKSGQGLESGWVEGDVTRMPGWSLLSEDQKKQWLDLSLRFLSAQQADPNGWPDDRVLHIDATGYRCLRLAMASRQDAILSRVSGFFEQWAPAVVFMNDAILNDVPDLDVQIWVLFWSRAPATMLRHFETVIHRQARRWDHLPGLRRTLGPAVKGLNAALWRVARAGDVLPGARLSLLLQLLRFGHRPARTLLRRDARGAGPGREADRIAALTALLSASAREDWRLVRSVFADRPEVVHEVIEAFVGLSIDCNRIDTLKRLGTDGLGELYEVLAWAYPPADDYDWSSGGVRCMSSEDEARDLRENILQFLKDDGSAEAIAELRRIATNSEDPTRLRWTLLDAETIASKKRQPTPTPAELNALLDGDGNYVASADHLVEIVLDGIRTFQERIREHPAILWDEHPEVRPKDENHLSTTLRQHLESEFKGRKIVVNREVEISQGEQTDLYVEAWRDNHSDVVRVVIETKGGWNRDLGTAMEAQLLRRYMNSPSRTHGIYLVGWFESPAWRGSDRRQGAHRRNRTKYSDEELRAEAESLSTPCRSMIYAPLNCTLRVGSQRNNRRRRRGQLSSQGVP
jgi:hypothetical protein